MTTAKTSAILSLMQEFHVIPAPRPRPTSPYRGHPLHHTPPFVEGIHCVQQVTLPQPLSVERYRRQSWTVSPTTTLLSTTRAVAHHDGHDGHDGHDEYKDNSSDRAEKTPLAIPLESSLLRNSDHQYLHRVFWLYRRVSPRCPAI